MELNSDAVDGAIQAVLAALASGLTWAEVWSCHVINASRTLCVHCLPAVLGLLRNRDGF